VANRTGQSGLTLEARHGPGILNGQANPQKKENQNQNRFLDLFTPHGASLLFPFSFQSPEKYRKNRLPA
jgi:hypothetical protein